MKNTILLPVILFFCGCSTSPPPPPMPEGIAKPVTGNRAYISEKQMKAGNAVLNEDKESCLQKIDIEKVDQHDC